MKQTEIITFGCRLNTFESEIMRSHCERVRLTNAVIINTCAVTAEAERQARQAIRRARRTKPDAKIVVTGCAAQLNPNTFFKMPEVDYVIGNEEKLHLQNYLNFRDKSDKAVVGDIMEVRETAAHLVRGFDGKSRAFVQIQQGCDHRCTFCIIPFARGSNRSVPFSVIVNQIQELMAGGYKEIVLTGVDICSYGVDLTGKSELGKLIQNLLKVVPDLPRLRLSSLDPASMGESLFQVLRDEERLMPHLHLSLQSMDDIVLKRMKRRHNSSEVLEVIERVKEARPGIVFGADIIAGFPTETAKMFENSVNGIRKLGITYLHVFPFSGREETPAAKMPPVEKSIRKNRAKILRKVGDKEKTRFLNTLVGTMAQVLVEKGSKGFTEHYAPVEIIDGESKKSKPGDIVNVKLTKNTGQYIRGLIY